MDKNKTLHRLAAAVTAGMIVGEAGSAHAGATTFATVGSNIITASSNLPSLISTVAYVGGIGLGVAGTFKLKQHVDNPGQTPLKDGLVRLGAGGGLLSLPYVASAMQGSIQDQGGAPAVSVTMPAPAPPTGGG